MWFFNKFHGYLLRFWFFIFDRLILYPMMRYMSPVLGVQFMNLGYWPTQDSAEEDAEIIKIIERNSSKTDPDCPHYYLYEKSLALHPEYPILNSLQLLEVGCGLGNGIKWIKRAHPSIKTLRGIDRCAVKGTCVISGDAHKLPFGDHQFDIVLNVESSHLYQDCEQFFRECARVLKKGGYLCWIDLRHQSQVCDTRWQATRAGLSEERWDDVTNNVLEGVRRTASRYDKMLQKAPLLVRVFSSSLRDTYCAPGTHTYARFVNGEKGYYAALWKNKS